MTDEQLFALLRLKRYEQPPPQYFEKLLQDVHRRQRCELLRRPLWRIMVERVQIFFSEHSMGNVSYAGAMTAALVGGLAVIGAILPGGSGSDREALVAASSEQNAPARRLISLEAASTPPEALEAQPFQRATGLASTQQPRYVIDARPVSYEASFEF